MDSKFQCMMHFRLLGSAEIVIMGLIILTTLSVANSERETYNITTILSKFPEFLTFSHYLTLTRLSSEINKKKIVTVCAVDNDAMSQLLLKGLPRNTVGNILSLHIILGYCDAKKLHLVTNGTIQAPTMLESSGSLGIINITRLRGGKVGFGFGESGLVDAYFVKSVVDIPYKLRVIQISAVLSPRGAKALPSQPSQMSLMMTIMTAHGCKDFAKTLLHDSNANRMFMENVGSGLTIFCPLDEAFREILPKYNNLSAGDKESLLELHGVPVYLSFSMLKLNNVVMNTLATEGGNSYQFSVQNNGNQVTLKTKIMTTRIMGKLLDRQPLAIFTVDKVLLPHELFKSALPQDPVLSISPKWVASPTPKSSRRHLSPPAPDTEDFTHMDSPDKDKDDVADIVTAITKVLQAAILALALVTVSFLNTIFTVIAITTILGSCFLFVVSLMNNAVHSYK